MAATTALALVDGHPPGDVLEVGVRLAQLARAGRSSRGRSRRARIVAISLACFTVSVGSATIIRPSTESASATPLRSVIVPRLAGSVTRHDALGLGLGDVRLRVDALQLEEPGGEHRDHHRDQEEADPQPDAATRPAADRSRGAAGARAGRAGRSCAAAGRSGRARRWPWVNAGSPAVLASWAFFLPAEVLPRRGCRAVVGRLSLRRLDLDHSASGGGSSACGSAAG